MRILQYRSFATWAKAEKLNFSSLHQAIKELDEGLFDASLGGHVYKKRIGRVGQGKRGGYRTLIAFKQADRAIFIIGFAKNERDNITTQEKAALKRMAKDYLSLSDQELNKLIKMKELIEVPL